MQSREHRTSTLSNQIEEAWGKVEELKNELRKHTDARLRMKIDNDIEIWRAKALDLQAKLEEARNE